MPDSPLRPCATSGCPTLVRRGHCPIHTTQINHRRGSAARRGYGSHWQRFRPYYINLLIQQHILPVCGARLPEGPQESHSRCRTHGLLNGEGLHLNHHPPLRDDERQDIRAVCDPTRIELLCATCHNALTRLAQRSGSDNSRHGMALDAGGRPNV